MRERVIDIETPSGRMPTFVTHPEQDGPFPAVIVYMDIWGVREELHEIARRVGTVGYYCMVPDFYYRQGRVRHEFRDVQNRMISLHALDEERRRQVRAVELQRAALERREQALESRERVLDDGGSRPVAQGHVLFVPGEQYELLQENGERALENERRRTMAPDDEWNHIDLSKVAKRLSEEGVLVNTGAHGQREGLGLHWELWMMQSGGMKNHDALRAATYFGADAIGLSKDLGTLEVGKLADLQVLDQNPLENIRNTNSIRYVMKNGRLYDANTLDEMWPRVRPLPTQWWWREDPPAPKAPRATQAEGSRGR